MEIRHLLKSQANRLFEAIQDAGLEPTDFEWRDTTNLITYVIFSKLVHTPSGYYFTFNNYSGFESSWTPGMQTLSDSEYFEDWDSQVSAFTFWLEYLKRETESPDLWAAVGEGAGVLETAASADTSNVPFTAKEKAYIIGGINEIKEFLLTAHSVDPELVESRLSYLIESSERVGRKDWINLLISVLVGIVISAALPPEVTRELFRFAGTVLRQIINMPLLLS
jgi:hypothetical protein